MIERLKENKIKYLLLAGLVLLVSFLWLSLRPVKIVAVHQRNNYSDVLVKNFPFTDSGKINWWLKNKAMLKSRYNIPKPASYGNFTIIFWSFGNGYMEREYEDRLCFEDMKIEKNCIEKNMLFSVNNDIRGKTHLRALNSGDYLLKEDGKVVKDDEFIITVE